MRIEKPIWQVFKRWGIKVPGHPDRSRLNPRYAVAQIDHIDEVLRMDPGFTEAEEYVLRVVRAEWLTHIDQDKPTSAEAVEEATAPAPTTFFQFVGDRNIRPPDSYVTSVEDADLMYERINNALLEPPPTGEIVKRLVGWRRGWSAVCRKMRQDFGGAAAATTGPSAQQLARKAEKRERDRQLRNQMRGGAGKK
jgi:hypothetical protein